MKPFSVKYIASAAILTGLFILASCAGCKVLFYPAARAFGGPKESELKVQRQAFADMKTEIRGGLVIIFPIEINHLGGQQRWNRDVLDGAVEFLRHELSPLAVRASETPGVPELPLHKNQMRYAVKRGRAYAEWIASRHAAGDYFIFTEGIRNAEIIVGGLICMIDADGRVAYLRWYNSHHFDPATMSGMDAFLEWMLEHLIMDLDREPLDLFPRYGVG